MYMCCSLMFNANQTGMSGEKNVFTNYRPVSLLLQFSKILEKKFNNKLDSFIEKYNILSGNQYGFRTKHSTPLALIEVSENLSASIDSKNITVGVFIISPDESRGYIGFRSVAPPPPPPP